MGLFNKLFGGNKDNSKKLEKNLELRLQYNLMHNITLEKSNKYQDTKRYELVEDGIYIDLKDEDDAKYRMTIAYELESNETNNQYPLEDILDKYLMHVEDFLLPENDDKPNTFKLELGGYLEKMKTAKEIIGKKVFNREFKDKEGITRVDLIIE